MAKCPNCGRDTARTLDWCCQWCGFPLSSGSYKTIEKTYRELKEERAGKQPVREEPVVEEPAEPEPAPEIEEKAEISEEAVEEEPEVVEEEPAAEEEPEVVEEEPVAEEEPEVVEEEPAPKKRRVRRRRVKKKPEPEPVIEEEPVAEEETEEVPEQEEAAEPEETVEEPEEEAEIEEEPEAEEIEAAEEPEEEVPEEEVAGIEEPEEEKPEKEAEEEPAEKQETEKPAIELTVDELVSAYENEGPAADARFSNQILKLTGLIGKIEVKEAQDIFTLTLTDAEADPTRQTVRCVFNRQHGTELRQLTSGQTVTIQGQYDGSIINISMRECELVQ